MAREPRGSGCYLLDVSRDAPAVEDVEAVEGPGRRRHRLRLHLRRHVGVLHHRLSFQHGATVSLLCSRDVLLLLARTSTARGLS